MTEVFLARSQVLDDELMVLSFYQYYYMSFFDCVVMGWCEVRNGKTEEHSLNQNRNEIPCLQTCGILILLFKETVLETFLPKVLAFHVYGLIDMRKKSNLQPSTYRLEKTNSGFCFVFKDAIERLEQV